MTVQGLQPWELPLTPPSDIEPGVASLVRSINEEGMFRTRQSCEGHPHRGEGPWVWIDLSPSMLPELWAWMDRANAQLPEWLIDCRYLGQDMGRLWFEIRGRYLNSHVSNAILVALERTL